MNLPVKRSEGGASPGATEAIAIEAIEAMETIETIKAMEAVGADGRSREEKGHRRSAVGGVGAQDLP